MRQQQEALVLIIDLHSRHEFLFHPLAGINPRTKSTAGLAKGRFSRSAQSIGDVSLADRAQRATNCS